MFVSAKGITAGAGHTTAATVVGAIPAVAVDTAIVGDSALATYDIGAAALADTKDEINSGADKFVLGGSIALLGKSFAPQAVKVAQAAQTPINADSSALVNCFTIPRNAASVIAQEKAAETLSFGIIYVNPNKISVSKKVVTDGKIVTRTRIYRDKLRTSKYDPNTRNYTFKLEANTKTGIVSSSKTYTHDITTSRIGTQKIVATVVDNITGKTETKIFNPGYLHGGFNERMSQNIELSWFGINNTKGLEV